MMYCLQVSFLGQILLVFKCQVQTHSKADESQRSLLREKFHKALIDDSQNLLSLQQAFLTPHHKSPNGFYLVVLVTVEGRVNTDIDDQYLIDYYCSSYNSQNNSCVYQNEIEFEVSPPDQYTTVKKFLYEDDIRSVLTVLDPSFCFLASVLRGEFYHNDFSGNGVNIILEVNIVEIMIDDLKIDVRDALYLTLSWVSNNNVIVFNSV